MKRKADKPSPAGKLLSKKRARPALDDDEPTACFRSGLFAKAEQDKYAAQHGAATPYRHCVIPNLVDDALLRAVRDDVIANVSFTPKETDIYKIHQSGDLANLDGLDHAALSKLPSLLRLRDALYSPAFRRYVSDVTGCGPLSGRKTDLAINIYAPGCYLLCHDDVIGSRKVSYILYLTDPDEPWRAAWGGALRLFPVAERRGAASDEVALTTLPDPTKVIPPAWNQLAFFAVQPGVSFHDVEEVYHRMPGDPGKDDDGGRVRMAVSGWFHIPQLGEDGYVEGAAEENERNSGLMQLRGNPDQHDQPRPRPVAVAREASSSDAAFNEADLDFLLKYLAPHYLTPDTLERVADNFEEDFSITLPSILSAKFAARVRAYVEAQESKPTPRTVAEVEKSGPWKVAVPPNKHKFLYLQPGEGGEGTRPGAADDSESESDSPVRELLDVFLPSRQFRVWLQMATGSTIESHDFVARRFRRGHDFTLAMGHEGKPRLELNLGITPTTGWGDEDDYDDEDDEDADEEEGEHESEADKKNGGFGGHEVYLAGDEDGGDAAVYRSSTGGDDDGSDDNILVFQAPAWNKLTLILRDSGTMRFVKYVSAGAKGDRWDISGTYEVEEQDEEPDDDDDDDPSSDSE